MRNPQKAYHGRIIRRNVQRNVLSGVQRNQVIEHGPRVNGKLFAALRHEKTTRTLRFVSYPNRVLPPDRLYTSPLVI